MPHASLYQDSWRNPLSTARRHSSEALWAKFIKMVLDIHEYFYPIFAGEQRVDEYVPKNVFGTASHIGNNHFITTSHTIKNALQSGIVKIGFAINRKLYFVNICESETLDDLDLCLFRLEENLSPYKTLNISFNRLEMLEDVSTAGFPHGLDFENNVLRNRALKGYIVNHGPFFRFHKKPLAYELSFQCPKGISGAPLMKFYPNKQQFIVHGYIIGNTNTEITVFTEKETSSNGIHTSIYEKTESTKYGIAINNQELQEINSSLVGNIHEHFKNLGLLI
jgi:hypothetical protein